MRGIATRGGWRGTRLLVGTGLSCLLAACAGAPAPAAPDADPVPVLVTERFVSAASPADEIDSLAAWRAPDGGVWLLATAKSGGRILRYDGLDGRLLGRLDAAGAGAVLRPNGIAVSDDIAFVVDQRAQRVLLLGLPDGAPLGAVGEGVLRNPYGLWVQPLGTGAYALYVTDSYRLDGGVMPPPAQLGERLRLFQVQVGDGVQWRALKAFGETDGQGVLLTVESIAGDPVHDRLLVAEEERGAPSGLQVYRLDGRYAGRRLAAGIFDHQAEGIVLVGCDDGNGYWVASDQHAEAQRFHVFDRRDLAWLGAFRGATVRDTDGLAYAAGPLPGFPHGALYVQHDNRAVAAFDWAEVAAALGLRPDCG